MLCLCHVVADFLKFAYDHGERRSGSLLSLYLAGIKCIFSALDCLLQIFLYCHDFLRLSLRFLPKSRCVSYAFFAHNLSSSFGKPFMGLFICLLFSFFLFVSLNAGHRAPCAVSTHGTLNPTSRM